MLHVHSPLGRIRSQLDCIALRLDDIRSRIGRIVRHHSITSHHLVNTESDLLMDVIHRSFSHPESSNLVYLEITRILFGKRYNLHLFNRGETISQRINTQNHFIKYKRVKPSHKGTNAAVLRNLRSESPTPLTIML
jgi:hypothetical protein